MWFPFPPYRRRQSFPSGRYPHRAFHADNESGMGEKIEAVKESKEEYVMAKRSADESGSYSRFLSGECCNRLGPEVLEMIAQTTEYLSVLNDIKTSGENREEIISKIFKNFGKYSSVGRNFTCQCGKHISIGEKTIVNDNCTMMDENYIHIGNNVLIAPNVQFYTASHPIDYRERFVENWDESSGELFFRTSALPITVEDNVWIGGGSIILGGYNYWVRQCSRCGKRCNKVNTCRMRCSRKIRVG